LSSLILFFSFVGCGDGRPEHGATGDAPRYRRGRKAEVHT
jgi:hypothetical protein